MQLSIDENFTDEIYSLLLIIQVAERAYGADDEH